METPTTETKKGFFQNDRLLVCSLFAFYGLCFFSLMIGSFWWLNRRNQMISANTTATAAVAATQQASIFERATEQAQYKFIDRFDSNTSRWFAGPQNNDYWEGTIQVKDGVYSWKVDEVKETFVWWADFYHGFPVQDFDVYLDTKFVAGSAGDICGGLVFRKSSEGWDDGAYIFTTCNDSTYKIDYHGKDG